MKRLPDDYECDGQISLMDYTPRSNHHLTSIGYMYSCEGCICEMGYDTVWCEHQQRGTCPLKDGGCKSRIPHDTACLGYRKACIYYKPNSLRLEKCLNAVLTCYDDGTKECPRIDSWGCELCMEVWERRHKDD